MSESDPGEEPFRRGHVVWHHGLFSTKGRPWLVMSDDSHPFHGEGYIVAGVTTTERSEAIELDGEAWQIGGLPRTSYVSPWFLTTLKHVDITRGVGALSDEVVAAVTDQCKAYLE